MSNLEPTVIAHDADGRAYRASGGNLYVEERIERVANTYGYGAHDEHRATTRSRALKRARAAFGADAVITDQLGQVHISTERGNTTRMRYAVVVYPGAAPQSLRTVTGYVRRVEWLGHTVNGNGMANVTIEAGAVQDRTQNTEGLMVGDIATYRLSNDAGLVYAIENPEYRDEPHTFALTRAGRISHVVRG